MPGLTKGEAAQITRFELIYARSNEPVLRSIERSVCGCDYGGNSWTTRQQADRIMDLLELTPDCRLVDLGAGTGWPGLYFAQETGCAVTLVDLPDIGLRIASERAHADGIGDRTTVRRADASDLPFGRESFDAITHSDLLCCLIPKRAVLEECRRILRPSGRMVFTVISIRPGLSEAQHLRAVANAPAFVEGESDYRRLLDRTGWRIVERVDMTDAYRRSCARQVKADQDNYPELVGLFGPGEAAERLDRWQSKLAAIEDGLYLREQFFCRSRP